MKSKIAFLLLFLGLTLPVYAKQVTLAQLEELLALAQGKPDADVARQLWDLELTERLSSAQLTRLQVQFPGTKTRQSLLAIADASAFLKLPAAEAHRQPPASPTSARSWAWWQTTWPTLSTSYQTFLPANSPLTLKISP